MDRAGIIKKTKDDALRLSNFEAEIIKEIVSHDGDETTTQLVITGRMFHKDDVLEFPPVTVDSQKFDSMNWLRDAWGIKPVIFPVPGAERDIAHVIQITSTPETVNIFTATGWHIIDDTRQFVAANAAITNEGLNPQIVVSLPKELSRITFHNATTPTKDALAASLRLTQLGEASKMWPLVLAPYKAIYGNNDFAIHLAGKTGTFKSEIASLIQAHFGKEFTARTLPCSWNSTANALEAMLWRAKDTVAVVDDYVPVGVAYNVRMLNAKADQVIRAAGNQAGRQRMTDTSSLQQTMHPRALILSTGEDIPDGHSIRGRMLILETVPGWIDKAKLTAAQKARPVLSDALAQWIRWNAQWPQLQERYSGLVEQWRDNYNGLGHSRTPSALATLRATLALLAEYCTQNQLYSDDFARQMEAVGDKAIRTLGEEQKQYIEGADPCLGFYESLRAMCNLGQGHITTIKEGIPENPELHGFKLDRKTGQIDQYVKQGTRLGWIDFDQNTLYVDPAVIPLIKRFSGGKIAISPETLIKRLKDSGFLTRTDQARQRNTVRMTLAGSVRNVVACRYDQFMQD